ncbi:sigma-70 family RNA polymerase sigma factor [Acutalibacter sp.]|uniref:sigma-70 family RNA polymerase sigma factor n=1 Tax=Acutalibacter sp. TaxID=1918636 RepID=UPI0034DFCBD0
MNPRPEPPPGQRAEGSPLVTENLGLVHLCARRFMGRGVEYDDLFQAGCVGLVKAAEHFDLERGVKFSTYAVPVILGEVRRLFRDGGAVRVSRGLRELAQKVLKAEEALRDSLGRAPTVEELARTLEITPEKAALALGALRQPVSLTGGEEGEQLEIPVEAPEEAMTERLTLRGIIQGLEERDQKLIYYRYYKSMTQTQTADLLGMTQVQVSRREKKLLAYMRQEFEG